MKKILFFLFFLLYMRSLLAQPAAPVAQWVSIGPEHINRGMGANGRITSIAIDHTNSKIIYGGARGTGLWKTTDGGENWRPVTDNLPSLQIEGIAIAKADHNVIYIVTPVGVYRSLNAGSSWDRRYAGNLNAVDNSLIIHPADPMLLYMAGDKEGNNDPPGVYQSTDGGSTWVLIMNSGVVTSLVIDPLNASRFYAGVSNRDDVSRTGIYEGINNGTGINNWRKLSGCPGARLPAVTDPQTSIKLAMSQGRLYASFKTSTDWTLYRTTELACSIGGIQEQAWKKCWRPEGDIDGDPIFRRLWNSIYTDPNDRDHVFASGTELYVSSDGGDHFTRIPGGTANTPHVDYHAYYPDPADSKIVFFGTDGGLYRSSNRGRNNWKFVGKGMAVTEFYNMATASEQRNTIIAGTQDNGMSKYTGSKNWNYLVGGDSEYSEISPKDNRIYYEAGQRISQLKKSTNAGGSWSGAGSGLGDCDVADEFGYTKFQVLAHPDNASVVYATCDGLWKGMPWQRIFNPAGDELRQIAIDKRTHTLFAGTRGGNIYTSTDDVNFNLVFHHPDNAATLDIESDPHNESRLYLASSSTLTGRIYIGNKKNGRYWFTDISSNLPDGVRVNTIAVDLMRDRTLYAGTLTAGVYKGVVALNDTVCTWTPYNNRLPNGLTVTDLEVQPVTGVLRAVTFGRGAYEVNTDNPIGSTLSAAGRVVFLRLHTAGSGYGSGHDMLDAEVIVKVDTEPEMSFGIQLRKNADEKTALNMYRMLQQAFKQNAAIQLEYVKKSLHTGMIIRTIN